VIKSCVSNKHGHTRDALFVFSQTRSMTDLKKKVQQESAAWKPSWSTALVCQALAFFVSQLLFEVERKALNACK